MELFGIPALLFIIILIILNTAIENPVKSPSHITKDCFLPCLSDMARE